MRAAYKAVEAAEDQDDGRGGNPVGPTGQEHLDWSRLPLDRARPRPDRTLRLSADSSCVGGQGEERAEDEAQRRPERKPCPRRFRTTAVARPVVTQAMRDATPKKGVG